MQTIAKNTPIEISLDNRVLVDCLVTVLQGISEAAIQKYTRNNCPIEHALPVADMFYRVQSIIHYLPLMKNATISGCIPAGSKVCFLPYPAP